MRHHRRRRPPRHLTQVVGFALSGITVLATGLHLAEPPVPAAAQDLRAAVEVEVADPAVPSEPAVEPTADATTEPASTPSEGRFTIAFAGDVHAERQIADALAAGTDVLADLAPTLSAADLAIVNLETPVGDAGAAAAKSYSFQAPEALLPALARAGVDVVSLANNHALDRGIEGLRSTITAAATSGVLVVGGGEDAEAAYAPLVVERHGIRVAVVALSRVLPHHGWTAGVRSPGLASGYDTARAVDAVRAARAVAEHVVVFVHWGTERSTCPDTTQVELARALHGAGARVVVGAHPHVFQGIAQPRPDQLTAYSLGNFLWYATADESGLTGVLTVTLDRSGVADVSVVPARIGIDGSPHHTTAADAERLQAAISSRVPGAGCPADGVARG